MLLALNAGAGDDVVKGSNYGFSTYSETLNGDSDNDDIAGFGGDDYL
ncbi:MAG: hypothetical protein ACOZNI_36265 [Myxococcota bacterium]